ncbi:LOW QUALITY PROTEIN: ATP-binding cassette sub-family G member 1-like [Ornithodoros turicata]|uniref:LOW QUALITY PROTEIN: ATP-binding cassette sub-family G member 1-like n=1 Tax=Ornithodoros turicata TaxID=34597 RepID=UPI0031398BD1
MGECARIQAMELKPKIVSRTTNGPSQTPEASRHRISITWKNLSYRVTVRKERRYLLHKLAGTLEAGQLTAIMGPSGAGKTTLLNILSGFHPKGYEGEIFVNGVVRRRSTFRKLVSYVMNGDYLLPHLTARESLQAAAQLKLDPKVSDEERRLLVDKVLSIWSLEECADTVNNKLSTGQRKRLSVAQELASNPPLVFLDEPTSGLDSSNSLQCILTLKEFAARGHTIVCSIHQPSSKIFQLLDKLYVLADGRCIYSGPTEDCVPFMSNQGLECPPFYNPADFLIELASGDFGDVKQDLASIFSDVTRAVVAVPASSTEEVDEDNPSKTPLLANESGDLPPVQGAPLCVQLRVLLKRNFLSIVREPLVFHLRLATHIIVGLLMGLLYYDIGNRGDSVFNNATFVFFSLLVLLFTGMMPVVLIFPLEASVFVREHANAWYSLKAYFFAKTLADVPFQVVFPAIFVAIVYWMTAQPPELDRFGLFALMAVLLSFSAQSLGMLIGALASVESAVFLGPALTVPLLLFSGFVVTLRAIPRYLQWLSYASYVRYAYEGSMLAVYGFQRQELHCDEAVDETAVCLFTEPQAFLSFLGFDAEGVYLDVIALLVATALFKVATYAALKFRTRRFRVT